MSHQYHYVRSDSDHLQHHDARAPPAPLSPLGETPVIFHTTSTVVAPSAPTIQAPHPSHSGNPNSSIAVGHDFPPLPLSHDDKGGDSRRYAAPAVRAPPRNLFQQPSVAVDDAPPTTANPGFPSSSKDELDNHAHLISSKPHSPNIVDSKPKTSALDTIKTFFRAFNTPNQLALLALIGIQAICALSMIALIYATINDAIGDLSFQDTFLVAPKLEFVATYLGVFILAVIFEILVALDALQQKNIISIYLITFFQIAMLVYSAVLPSQLDVALRGSSADTHFVHNHVKGYAIAIPCVVALVTAGLGFLSWRLNDEFNWELFRRVVGPEVHLRRMYLVYQIFVGVLKFDAFFFIGFSIQFLVLVTGVPVGELAVTIAALPIICVFLFFSSLFVKHEFRSGVYLTLVIDLAGMAYFVYKLYRVYVPSEYARYVGARKTLTIFSVLSLVFLVVTFCLNALCMSNFDRGLKERIPRFAWAGRSHALSSHRRKRMSIGPDGSKIVDVVDQAPPQPNLALERSRTRMSLD
ncbi:BQ5605_C022g09430 [Microbotryum silenes-dioicae]|uniref:BQ5605_C022g09430 protein n=1 Tax=Microbotryum silenes-dioicae TaxID=796604 RepID=A0A2X0MN70_9BASI|nr:BQ5605_C022g09430 [Microbotryum silenes-dioicae]